MNESTELAASGEQEASPAVITPFQLEVQNLVVGAISREILRLGDSASLAKFAETERDRVRLIVWNEGGLSLVMGDRTSEVLFVPEIYPETEMFFSREHKRDKQGYGGSSGNRVWEGEYEPVLFAKKDLVKFLARHSGGDKGLLDSVKTLRVTQRKDETEEMLDLESDNVRRTQEETEVSNVPRHFSLKMPVTEGTDALFEFEASIYKGDDEDSYQRQREGQHKRIAVRVVNARPVLRDVMKGIIDRLPPGIPRLYGRHGFHETRER